MPEIHDPPLLAPSKSFHHVLHHPRDSLPAPVQDPGIRIPLQRHPPSRNLDRIRRIIQPIQADDIIAGIAQLVQRIPGPLGKDRRGHDVNLQLLQPPRQLLRDVSQVRQGEVPEARRRELARPRVKHHDELGARDDLPGEVLDAQARDDQQQRLRLGRIPVQPGLGLAEDLAATAFDHVAQQGPGRAAEADERDAALELLARQRDGLVDVVELRGDVGGLGGEEAAVLRVGGRGQRVREGGAPVRQHLHRHPHRLRDHEDVAEDDRRVDQPCVPLDRLQRQRRRDFRRAAACEEVVVAFGDVVFGEVPAGWGLLDWFGIGREGKGGE
jgi:hypothetical protein